MMKYSLAAALAVLLSSTDAFVPVAPTVRQPSTVGKSAEKVKLYSSMAYGYNGYGSSNYNYNYQNELQNELWQYQQNQAELQREVDNLQRAYNDAVWQVDSERRERIEEAEVSNDRVRLLQDWQYAYQDLEQKLEDATRQLYNNYDTVSYGGHSRSSMMPVSYGGYGSGYGYNSGYGNSGYGGYNNVDDPLRSFKGTNSRDQGFHIDPRFNDNYNSYNNGYGNSYYNNGYYNNYDTNRYYNNGYGYNRGGYSDYDNGAGGYYSDNLSNERNNNWYDNNRYYNNGYYGNQYYNNYDTNRYYNNDYYGNNYSNGYYGNNYNNGYYGTSSRSITPYYSGYGRNYVEQHYYDPLGGFNNDYGRYSSVNGAGYDNYGYGNNYYGGYNNYNRGYNRYGGGYGKYEERTYG